VKLLQQMSDMVTSSSAGDEACDGTLESGLTVASEGGCQKYHTTSCRSLDGKKRKLELMFWQLDAVVDVGNIWICREQ